MTGCPKLSGARNQVGENVRPKGGSRGPSSRDGCGAPGNDADGFTPPEMFLACATATALGEGPFISPNRTFDGFEKERADCSDILSRWLTTDQVPTIFLALSVDWQ